MKNFWPTKTLNNPKKNLLTFLLIVSLVFNSFLTTTGAEEDDLSSPIEATSTTTDLAVISTGDATSVLEQESIINTNEINLEENIASTTNYLTPNSSSTKETTETNFVENSENSNTGLSVNLSNQADSENNATSTANTGDNSTQSDGNFVTETGDAVSYINLTNVVNTNIVNSTGLIDFIQEVLGYENFDMRDSFMDIFNSLHDTNSTIPCVDNICDPNAIAVDLNNQANIYNNVSVTANTGNNSNAGTGSIATGDAYANANVVNIANTNIIDSNYLLLVFNNFSDLAGSLVLPNSDFFQSLMKQNHGKVTDFYASNSASVINNTETIANTGDNYIEGIGTSTIETGNSTALSSTQNIINQNFLNSNSFSMLIRVHGDWSGDIFGLPDGMEWERNTDGIRLFYNPEKDFDKNASVVANITNNTNITNNVSVFALTGENEISNNNGTSQIKTGDAIADNTIINIANTNLVGSNWINLIFNIYGNWSGDIAFGQPNLWLGLSAQDNNRMIMRPGNELSYTYTIFNRGDVTAKNVTLESEFPLSSLELRGNYTDFDPNDGKTIWSIGDIKAGETKEITIPAKIIDSYGKNSQLPLPLSANVYSEQKDADPEDNSDTLVLYVKEGSKKDKPSYTFPAKFVIEKSADKIKAQPGEAVNYTIKLINRGGPVFDALLVDTLRDETGNILSEQTWPLDKIKNNETITITYTVNLPKDLKSGIYTNTAQLVGLHGSESKTYRTPYESAIVHHKLAVGETPEGEVLGLSVSSCSAYLTTYLGKNKNNDLDEVIKLQNFLQQYVQSDIDVTGIFDNKTELAVKLFQQQYAEEILTPWSMNISSGYVYYTTQKKINEMMCNDAIEFPLSTEQKQEIEYFKANKHKINPSDWLFSLNTNDLDQTPEKEIATDNTNMQPKTTYELLPSYLKSSFDLKDKISYLRLNNWRYLLRSTDTALLDY